MSVWTWVGRHTRAWKLGSILGAFAVLSGGLVLGMNSAAGSPAPPQAENPAPAKVAAPSRHYVVGTVYQAFKNGQVIVRGSAGRFFVIDVDPGTVVRQDRRSVKRDSLHRGTRVIILGQPRGGRLHADVVTITGIAPAQPLTPAPVATETPPSAGRTPLARPSVTTSPR
jgi:hypothetical protein